MNSQSISRISALVAIIGGFHMATPVTSTNADTSGIKAIAGELAALSKKLAKEQMEAEKIMAPAKTEKQVAGKGA